jgi:hypothetical protein
LFSQYSQRAAQSRDLPHARKRFGDEEPQPERFSWSLSWREVGRGGEVGLSLEAGYTVLEGG